MAATDRQPMPLISIRSFPRQYDGYSTSLLTREPKAQKVNRASLSSACAANSEAYSLKCNSDQIQSPLRTPGRLTKITAVVTLDNQIGRVSGFEVVIECNENFAKKMHSDSGKLSHQEMLALRSGIAKNMAVNFAGKAQALNSIDLDACHQQYQRSNGLAELSYDEVKGLQAVLNDEVQDKPVGLRLAIAPQSPPCHFISRPSDDASRADCNSESSATQGLSEWGDESSLDRVEFTKLEREDTALAIEPFNGVDQLVKDLKTDSSNAVSFDPLTALADELSSTVDSFVKDKVKARIKERQLEAEYISRLYDKKYNRVIGIQNNDKGNNENSDLMKSAVGHVEGHVKPFIWLGAGVAYALVGALIGAIGSVTLGLGLAATIIPAAWFIRKYGFETCLVDQWKSNAIKKNVQYANRNLSSRHIKDQLLPRGVQNLKANSLNKMIGDKGKRLEAACWNHFNDGVKISYREKSSCVKSRLHEIMKEKLFSSWDDVSGIDDEDVNKKLSALLAGPPEKCEAFLKDILEELTRRLSVSMDQVLNTHLPKIRLSYEATPAEFQRLNNLQRSGKLGHQTRLTQSNSQQPAKVSFELTLSDFKKDSAHRVNYEKHLKRRLWAGYLSGAFRVSSEKDQEMQLYSGVCRHLHKLGVIDYGSKIPKFLRNTWVTRLFNVSDKKYGVGKNLPDQKFGPKVGSVKFTDDQRSALKAWADQFWQRNQNHMVDLYRWADAVSL